MSITSFEEPLTSAQLGIWLGQQLDPQSPMYNAAEYIELQGPLNTSLFQQAIKIEVNQCITLQLQFLQRENRVNQVFNPHTHPLAYLDFSDALSPIDKAQEWMQICLQETIYLDKDPLFTQALIKLSENNHIWFQKIHHIASDGFGFYLLTQAIAERYKQLVKDTGGESASNTPLMTEKLANFKKTIDEDFRYQASSAYTADLKFWKAQLNDCRPAFTLTNTKGAIADQHLRKSSVISKHTFAGLKNWAQQLKVNWSDVLAACLALSIHQRTGSKIVTIGFPVMNRLGSASLKIPAMIMNIIPISIDLSAITTFSGLVQNISSTIIKCRPHQRFRYETMKSEILTPDNLPLFGPVLNIMPFDRQLDIDGIKTKIHNISAGPVEDISFAFTLAPNSELNFTVDANPNRYKRDQLMDIHDHISQIIAEAASSSDLPISMHKQYLSIVEGPSLPVSNGSILKSIYTTIENTPSAIALQAHGKILTYSQLAQQVARLSTALNKTETKENAIVALALPRSGEAIIAMLSCLLSGKAFVCIDPSSPPERNRAILADARPSILWVQDGNKECCTHTVPHEGATNILCSASLMAQTTPEQEDDWNITWKKGILKLSSSNHLGYIIYTSGSTGSPKGVAVSYKALSEFIAGANETYRINAKDRVLQFAPLQFDACIEEIFVALTQGSTLVLRNDEMLESMQAFLSYCDKWKVSVIDLPTAFWHELVIAATQSDLCLPPCIRMVIIGGEAVLPDRVKAWQEHYGKRIKLFNTYGPSEATVVATCADLTATSHVSIGSPIHGRICAVVDQQMQPIAKGLSGELLLLGAGLAEGYIGRDETTAKQFINVRWDFGSKQKSNMERAYRTGDRVRINSQNQIEYLGRIDNQFKVSGYRIEPTEIENALAELPKVDEAAITVTKAKDQPTLIVAHICSNEAWDLAHLRSSLRARLPDPMLPSQLHIHTSLPKNTSGKIDRKKLESLYSTLECPSSETKEALNEQQTAIFRVWSSVLGHRSISVDDNFFDIGGQSLQTIQVASRLSTQLNKSIEVALIFKYPTIRELTEALFISTKAKAPSKSAHELMKEDCSQFEADLPLITNQYNHSTSRKLIDKKQKSVLLTGATGFVGAQLLHHLLTETQHFVICCVRASSEELALQKIRTALSQQSLDSERFFSDSKNHERHARAHILLCDLEKEKIGLEDDAFFDLGTTIDCIIHNAANTSVMRDYQSLRKVNALCTGELLHLASINHAPFNLVSTIAIAQKPTNNATALPEEYIRQHSGLSDGYQQSKWVSERFAEIASAKGYPVTTYRLARVTGSEDSAYVNPKDLIWSVLQAGVPIKKLPQLALEEPWTPVDQVSKFIIRHGINHQRNAVFNLMPENLIKFTQILKWLAEAGTQFSSLPISQWCEAVKQLSPEEHHAIAEFFIQRSSQSAAKPDEMISLPKIDTTNFTSQSTIYGVSFPETTQELFHRYYAYAQSHFSYMQVTAASKQSSIVKNAEEPSYES